jgi:hypothetical protein
MLNRDINAAMFPKPSASVRWQQRGGKFGSKLPQIGEIQKQLLTADICR